jgi:histidine triad (HIT) family protein
MDNCVFCKIALKTDQPDPIVYEDPYCMAVISLHQKPRNHGHIVLFPKKHVQDIYGLPEALDAPMMSALRLLSRAAKKAFFAEGIHIRQNNERAAGQDVLHMHFHIIPRYLGDEFDAREYSGIGLEVRREQAERLRSAIHNGTSAQQGNAPDALTRAGDL